MTELERWEEHKRAFFPPLEDLAAWDAYVTALSAETYEAMDAQVNGDRIDDWWPLQGAKEIIDYCAPSSRAPHAGILPSDHPAYAKFRNFEHELNDCYL